MAAPIYNWNPFQDDVTCDIKQERVSTSGGSRVVFIPRAAPFFSNNFKLTNVETGKVLVEGEDFAFVYPFTDFITRKSRTVYGGVMLLGSTSALQLATDYSTIGGPFVLDEIAYAQLLADSVSSSRLVDWRDIINLPSDGFPADPHDTPLSQTVNYNEFASLIRNLTLAMNDETNNPTVQTQLESHQTQSLGEAHGGGLPQDVGLGRLQNYPPAVLDDLNGNSNQVYMTLAITRLLVARMLEDALSSFTADGDGSGGGSGLPADYLSIETAKTLFFQINNFFGELKDSSQKASARLALGLGELATLNMADVLPVGSLIFYPADPPPQNFLAVKGQNFDRAVYTELAIVYPSGKLPDARGEFVRGWDNGRGVDSGRVLLSAQDSTKLRTALADYQGSDGSGAGASNNISAIGIGYLNGDALEHNLQNWLTGSGKLPYWGWKAQQEGKVNTSTGDNDTSVSGALLTGGLSMGYNGKDASQNTTLNNQGLTGASQFLSLRPRNLAYQIIVKAR